MMNPVRSTTGWLAGRVLVFMVILAALVAWDAFRDESKLAGAMLKGLVPDQEVVDRLEQGRADVQNFASVTEQQVNQRLSDALQQSAAAMDARIAELQDGIAAKERQRRSQAEKLLAMLSGKGFEQDLKVEIEIQLLTAELDALKKIRGEINFRSVRVGSFKQQVAAAAVRTRRACKQYNAAREARDAYAASNPILSMLPFAESARRLKAMEDEADRHIQGCIKAGEELQAAQTALKNAQQIRKAVTEQVQAAAGSILGPLDEIVSRRREALESAKLQVQKVQQSIQRMLVSALAILVLVTLVPVGIKAFWYWVIAPFAEKRPPVRLMDRATGTATIAPGSQLDRSPTEKISAVSQEVTISAQEELLVHPEFLQRSASQGQKDTKWLLSWAYPFTSIAARMVALDRLCAPSSQSYVVSSKTDPFAEIGVISLADPERFVLQPRHLVGIVQGVDRPIQIYRRWRFNWHALITLQFRYLIFEGPGKLLVQGCRGVRLEQASVGRSIDQRAMMGFSVTLDYSPRRSETFAAYLMGTRALFNDHFSGGPGFYVYEEMPYFGKKSGITGRGLEGLMDGLMKVVGI